MDLQTARQRLLRIEAARTDLRSRHVLWEAGHSWLEHFNQLVAATSNNDQRLRQAIDTAPTYEQRRIESDERMHAVLEEERWNQRFVERLKRTHIQQRAVPQPNRALVGELDQHRIRFERHWRDRQVVLCQCALEHMEYRRTLGRLTDADWQQSWRNLLAAHRQQTETYEKTSAQPLPREFYTAGLGWLRRLRAIQSVLQRERRGSRVDQRLLRQHAALVDERIDQLNPSIAGGVFGGVLAAALAIALLVFFLRPGTPPSAGQTTVQPTAAASQVPQAITLPADPTAQNAEGVALLRQQRCDEALDLFQQAAAANPSWHEPHTNRGFCLYELGRRDEAIGEWRRAIELNAAGQDAHAGLGMALFQAGDREGGLREYQAALTMEGGYHDERWMQSQRDWSQRAIADSRPLREALP